jgi:hypothetical protein
MKGTKRSAAVLLAFGTAFALTPMAGAQEAVTPKFSLSGTDFMPGSGFTVVIDAATCHGGPVSITSPGFAGRVDLAALSGTFVTASGTYTATLKCRHTTEAGTHSFTIVKPKAPRTDPFLDKAEYAPGETIRIALEDGRKCGFEASSEGFTAPAPLTISGGTTEHPRLVGEAKAVNAPGSYQATIRCINEPVVNQFTVKAQPTTPPLPGNPAPKPKPPIVKPKGAPETGGGGTA